MILGWANLSIWNKNEIQKVVAGRLITISFGNVWCANDYHSKCSHQYANDIANILGRDFYRVIQDTIDELSKSFMHHPNHNPEATTKLVMNIGPGTSGTRSLYIAATQLNITPPCIFYVRHVHNFHCLNIEKWFKVYRLVVKIDGTIRTWRARM